MPPLSEARAGELSEALVSGDPLEAADAIAMPSGTAVSAEAAAQLKVMGAITVAADSSVPIDGVTGVVEAAGSDGRWKLNLVSNKGVWQIAATEKLS